MPYPLLDDARKFNDLLEEKQRNEKLCITTAKYCGSHEYKKQPRNAMQKYVNRDGPVVCFAE